MPTTSRSNTYPEHLLVNSGSERLSQQSQNRGSIYNPIHSVANANTIYYNTGLIVNPIESKYVPVVHSVKNGPLIQQMPVNQRVIYHNVEGKFGGRVANSVSFPKV